MKYYFSARLRNKKLSLKAKNKVFLAKKYTKMRNVFVMIYTFFQTLYFL